MVDRSCMQFMDTNLRPPFLLFRSITSWTTIINVLLLLILFYKRF